MENNDGIRSMVYDFIAGIIPFEKFWAEFIDNPKIGQWLDQVGDFCSELPINFPNDQQLKVYYRYIRNDHVGRVTETFPMEYYRTHNPYYTMETKSSIFGRIATVLLTIDSNVPRTKIYKQDENYYDKAVNRSIGGIEVESYIDSVLKQFPRTMKAADRVKAGRDAVQEAFHICDRKFPCWPQAPEWPMGKNSPMEYLGRHKDGELVQLRFRDVDTGEERIVEQFY